MDFLNQLEFVFHVALKSVREDDSLESIIVAQHDGLKANKVQPKEIEAILGGNTNKKVLLLLDGHDEYKTGMNSSIDKVIEKQSLWNCWLILTSRETKQLATLKDYMDTEAEIHGFDKKNVAKYSEKSLGSSERSIEFLLEAERSGLCEVLDLGEEIQITQAGILTIPIMLHMVCFLYKCYQTLPSSFCDVMQAIVDRCMDREALRGKGQKATERAKDDQFIRLGRLAWRGLNQPEKKLVFEKVKGAALELVFQTGLLWTETRMLCEGQDSLVVLLNLFAERGDC